MAGAGSPELTVVVPPPELEPDDDPDELDVAAPEEPELDPAPVEPELDSVPEEPELDAVDPVAPEEPELDSAPPELELGDVPDELSPPPFVPLSPAVPFVPFVPLSPPELDAVLSPEAVPEEAFPLVLPRALPLPPDEPHALRRAAAANPTNVTRSIVVPLFLSGHRRNGPRGPEAFTSPLQKRPFKECSRRFERIFLPSYFSGAPPTC